MFTPCPTYGTTSAYTNRACRCDACRRNNALRSRGRRSSYRSEGAVAANQLADLVGRMRLLEEHVGRLEDEVAALRGERS